MKTTTVARILVCHGCENIFQSTRNIMAHSCFSEKDIPEDTISSPRINSRKTCNFCKKTCVSVQTLYSHVCKKHSDKRDSFQFEAIEHERGQQRMQIELNNRRDYYCAPCNYSYKTKASYSWHLLTHGEKKLACELCGKRFMNTTGLNKHRNTHKEKEVPCDECGVLFKSKLDVKRHSRSVHQQIREHECDICSKKSESSKRMMRHKQEVHSNIKPFVCEICEFRCARFSNLQLHRKNVHKAAQMKVETYRNLVFGGNHPFVSTITGDFKY